MKKVLLLLLLCPFMAMAEFMPGIVTFNDGSTKSGLIDIPGTHSKKELKFKADKKAKAEGLSINDVKEFTIVSQGQNIKYKTLKIADIKSRKAGYKVEDEKSWARVEREGKISVLVVFFPEPAYYLQKEGDDHCKFLTVFFSGFVAGQFKALKTSAGYMFKDDCPQLEEALLKEDFKKRGVNLVAEKYEQLCGK